MHPAEEAFKALYSDIVTAKVGNSPLTSKLKGFVN